LTANWSSKWMERPTARRQSWPARLSRRAGHQSRRVREHGRRAGDD
jgi:hypothetical protein